MSSAASAIYTGAADVGEGVAYIKAITTTVLVCLFISSLVAVMVVSPNVYTAQVTGTVSSVMTACTAIAGDSPPKYSCGLQVSYTYNGTQYTNIAITTSSSTQYAVGNNITLGVNPNNPQSCEEYTFWTARIICAIVICVSIVVILFVWLIAYLTSKSKAFAALEGAGDVISLIHK